MLLCCAELSLTGLFSIPVNYPSTASLQSEISLTSCELPATWLVVVSFLCNLSEFEGFTKWDQNILSLSSSTPPAASSSNSSLRVGPDKIVKGPSLSLVSSCVLFLPECASRAHLEAWLSADYNVFPLKVATRTSMRRA